MGYQDTHCTVVAINSIAQFMVATDVQPPQGMQAFEAVQITQPCVSKIQPLQ
jgi:hypothetical protein